MSSVTQRLVSRYRHLPVETRNKVAGALLCIITFVFTFLSSIGTLLI